MISLLLPSRKRPDILARMCESAYATASDPSGVEIVVRYDDDDEESFDLCPTRCAKIKGPRIRKMTQYWNQCFEVCEGDVVCQANDDMVFTTFGWDTMVEEAFEEVPDKIMLAHGSDVYGHGSNFGPHAFVSRLWVETLGYFIPPHYSSDFGDAHINELANMIGRRRYLPFNIEHRHFSQGLAELDENTAERLQRHREDDPDTLYYSAEMQAERHRDAKKLAALMDKKLSTQGWCPPNTNIRSVGACPHPPCGSLSTISLGVGHFFCNACGRDFYR